MAVGSQDRAYPLESGLGEGQHLERNTGVLVMLFLDRGAGYMGGVG